MKDGGESDEFFEIEQPEIIEDENGRRDERQDEKKEREGIDDEREGEIAETKETKETKLEKKGSKKEREGSGGLSMNLWQSEIEGKDRNLNEEDHKEND
jgi:hypothetical protein